MGGNIKLKAFTLAEVLLVLSVIGVVAALTIPTLIQKVSNDQYVAKLKKQYSTISQAFNLVLNDYGGDITSLFTPGNSDSNVMNVFAGKLNLLKNCGISAGCLYSTPYYNLNGTQITNNMEAHYVTNNYAKGIFADGSILILHPFAAGNCNSHIAGSTGPIANSRCGTMDIDINGFSGPNTSGRDIFSFWVARTGIYPIGSNNDGYSCNTSPGDWTNSAGCAAKVLQESSMSY